MLYGTTFVTRVMTGFNHYGNRFANDVPSTFSNQRESAEPNSGSTPEVNTDRKKAISIVVTHHELSKASTALYKGSPASLYNPPSFKNSVHLEIWSFTSLDTSNTHISFFYF